MSAIVHRVPVRHGHLFCGLGSGAKGFNAGKARIGNTEAQFECVGGIDVDPAGIRDFERMTGVRGTLLDLFSLDQYLAFHGKPPAPGWRPALPADIRASFTAKPHIVFLSAPCKGFSGLLSEVTSKTLKYQALNELTLRGVWLLLEAYADDPVEMIIFENVPRIANRGRHLLDQITAMLRHFGYAVAETTHDCGEIGGLAQSRKRFLMVARHTAKVPPFLYEPPKRRLRGVGEVLDLMPLPGDLRAGPMHRIPALQWKTWVRLAFVEAGSDWRSLNKLQVADGVLTDFGILPDQALRSAAYGVVAYDQPAGAIIGESFPTNGRFAVADPGVRATREGTGFLGVRGWEDHAQLVTGNGRPGSGPHSVADPRPTQGNQSYGQYGVKDWSDTAATVTSQSTPGGGPHAIADPRVGIDGPRFNNVYRIVPWTGTSPAVTGGGGNSAAAVADPRMSENGYTKTKYLVTPYDRASRTVIGASTTGDGAYAVADPRPTHGPNAHQNKMRVVDYEVAAPVVTGSDRVGSGALSVADPRPRCLNREDREGYMTQGHYGVVGWDETAGAVPAFAKNNNGSWSVADPRNAAPNIGADTLPAANERIICVIRALDGTWHRPFTTLELAALQSFFDPEEAFGFQLDGTSDSAWRERIGNAVPAAAAAAIASVMGKTLLMAWAGESFALSSEPIWVQPLAIALSVDTGSQVYD